MQSILVKLKYIKLNNYLKNYFEYIQHITLANFFYKEL